MHGNVNRLSANLGVGSSMSLSYNFKAMSRSDEVHDMVSVLSNSASGMGWGMCDIAGWLYTVIWAGRQLLKGLCLPIHVRIPVSPDLVRTSANRHLSEAIPSPYITGTSTTEKMPNKEYALSSTRVDCRVEARHSFSRMCVKPGRSALNRCAETPVASSI